jgi:hypothetical protein
MGQSETSVEVENLRAALCWALAFIAQGDDEPQDGDGEVYEDYSGAMRLAWPEELCDADD